VNTKLVSCMITRPKMDDTHLIPLHVCRVATLHCICNAGEGFLRLLPEDVSCNSLMQAYLVG
jgi:hypothetical protein